MRQQDSKATWFKSHYEGGDIVGVSLNLLFWKEIESNVALPRAISSICHSGSGANDNRRVFFEKNTFLRCYGARSVHNQLKFR